VIDTTKVLSKLRVIKENLVKLDKLKEVPAKTEIWAIEPVELGLKVRKSALEIKHWRSTSSQINKC